MQETIINIQRKHARAELDELHALCEQAIRERRWADAEALSRQCERVIERLD